MSHQVKGAIISTTAILSALVSFFLMWDIWLSTGSIDASKQLSAIAQWQEDYGKKIDWLVTRSGANPEAITKFVTSNDLSKRP